MSNARQRLKNELRAWSWRRPVVIIALIMALVLSVAQAALAQTTGVPGIGDIGVIGVLLEKGSFAAIAIYLIYSQTKTQQASLDAIEKTLAELTVVVDQLKWHIERQSGTGM